jgi:hypothetical protein
MVQNRNGPGEIVSQPTRGDQPLRTNPHDGGAPNASAPTRVATHIQNASPGYTGVSPGVAAVMDAKIPPAFAQRIRDNIRRK